MKLSSKTRYGLLALQSLALLADKETKSVAQLAKEQDISQPYLETIVGMLRRSGIIHSVRGYQGGYALAKPSHAITLYDIVLSLEGKLAFVDQMEDDDGIRQVLSTMLWSKVDANLHRYLQALTLQQLCHDRFDDLMYYI